MSKKKKKMSHMSLTAKNIIFNITVFPSNTVVIKDIIGSLPHNIYIMRARWKVLA